MSRDSKKQKEKVATAFMYGMIAGVLVALALDYLDVSDKMWDLVEYGKVDVISCENLETYYQNNHLSPDWTERDSAAVDLLRHDCI